MTDPNQLPVWQNRKQILDALEQNQVIVVESPTGSGKTTQIPLILKEAGYAQKGVIGVTQPRRIATLSVCSYIHEQIKDQGLAQDYCGYKMRFYDTTGDSTRIKILTDGMLLQELKTDPLLSKYSVIMVDEAHERSLNIDFILGLLKQIVSKRDDIKVIISSATINTKAFAHFFRDNSGKDAPVITINARVYNVDIKYCPVKDPKDKEELPHSISQIINVLLKRFNQTEYKDNRDTLVFLPGEFEIKTVMQELYAFCDYKHLQIYPLYGRLNKEEQEMVFEPTQEGKMKVVLATNIAETSLTIDGIRTVIDSGLAKVNFYNQFDFTSSLVTKPISRASAMQRSGRAGRTSDGTCYRLYSKEDYNKRALYSQEEILRTDLSEVVLRMVDLGIRDFDSFPFITRPEKKALRSGEETLRVLGAIDKDRNLTPIGETMVRYPLLPRHSRCMAQAVKQDPDIVMPVAISISFLSCKTPFVLPPGEEDLARNAHRRYSSDFGDFINYQTLYRKYTSLETQKQKEEFCKSGYLDFQSMEEIVHVTRQLCEITYNMGIMPHETEERLDETFAKRLLTCLATGLIQYVCIKKKGNIYRTLNTDDVYIHPGSAWFKNPPPYLLAGEIVLTTKMYARTVSPMKREWIKEVAPDLAERIRQIARFEDDEKKKDTERNQRYHEESKKTYTMYGYTFDLVHDSGKKATPVAVIPYEELKRLAKTYRKASRHPKSVSCAILWNGKYIAFGERLYDIVMLSYRLNLNDNSLARNLSGEVFNSDTINKLKPYLGELMKLSPLAKYKERLGFVELISSGNSFFIHVNKSFSDALNNTAYSLLTISENISDNKAFSDAYNRVVKLLD